MLWKFIKRVQRNGLLDISAQLSYYLLMAFFPLMIAVVALLNYFPAGVELLLDVMESIVPKPAFQLVKENMEMFANFRGGIFSIGFVVALWITTRASFAIYKSLNHAYSTQERHFAIAALISFCITLSLILFVALSLSAILLSNQFILQFAGHSRVVFWLSQLRIWGMFLIFVLALSVIYAVVPRIRLSFRAVLPGAIIATLLWIVCTVGFEIYLNNFANFALIYGTLGGFVVMLLWLYLVSFSLLLGNEINAFLYEKKQKS